MFSKRCLSAPRNRYLEKRSCCSLFLFSGSYFRALAVGMMKSVKAKCSSISCSRGCFGRFSRKPVNTAANEPSSGVKNQGQPQFSDEISFSFSTSDMDNNPSASSSNPSGFVNNGLIIWNQTRQQWLANKKSERRTEPREPTISWNSTYESLLGTNKPFPRPIPLPEMVDFLVDIWEEEGLYD